MHIMTKRGWKPLRVRNRRQPIYVRSLLEQEGLDGSSIVHQYIEAIRRFTRLKPDHPLFINESRMFSIMSMKNVDGKAVPKVKRDLAPWHPEYDDGKPRLSADLWWKNQIRY